MENPSPWRSNRRKLLGILEEEGAKALVLGYKYNIVYATGLREPSGLLVLSPDCGDKILVPLLDYYRIAPRAPKDFEVYAFYRGGEKGVEADVPQKNLLEGSPVDALARLLGDQCRPVISDLSHQGYSLAKALESKLEARDASKKISRARAVKSDEEIALVEKAVEAAEHAFTRALDALQEGASEAMVATLIHHYMALQGAWGEAFPTIVAFYSNTALPHHDPGQDKLTVPGPILIDWGAIYGGYRSDSTRTMWWGPKATEHFQRHLEAVIEAVNAALDVIGPGVRAADVDNAARKTLRDKGLSKYFIHGLGHGVGVDIHEEPYLRPGSETILEPGMIVTIEPGVYLPGLHGIRIEDLVLITKTGFRPLTRLPHEIPL